MSSEKEPKRFSIYLSGEELELHEKMQERVEALGLSNMSQYLLHLAKKDVYGPSRTLTELEDAYEGLRDYLTRQNVEFVMGDNTGCDFKVERLKLGIEVKIKMTERVKDTLLILFTKIFISEDVDRMILTLPQNEINKSRKLLLKLKEALSNIGYVLVIPYDFIKAFLSAELQKMPYDSAFIGSRLEDGSVEVWLIDSSRLTLYISDPIGYVKGLIDHSHNLDREAFEEEVQNQLKKSFGEKFSQIGLL